MNPKRYSDRHSCESRNDKLEVSDTVEIAA